MTYRNFVNGVLFLVVGLVLLGGATRAFDAGVSCPDWPHCYGVWWPWPESAVPGGYVVGARHFVWGQVALEWVHRLVAATVGLAVLAMAGLAYWRPRREVWPLLAMVFTLGIQGLIGGVTVLKANVPWSVSVHLGMAMLFVAALVWYRREVAAEGRGKSLQVPVLHWVFMVGLTVLIWVLMMVGALVSSSYSGGVCGGLFDCAGYWIPADFGGFIHMLHRYLAVAVLVLSGVWLGLAKRGNGGIPLRKAARHLHLMVWGQVVLGVLTLYSFGYFAEYYHALSVTHLGWGTLVFVAALGNLLTMAYGSAGRIHGSGSDAPVMRSGSAGVRLKPQKRVK